MLHAHKHCCRYLRILHVALTPTTITLIALMIQHAHVPALCRCYHIADAIQQAYCSSVDKHVYTGSVLLFLYVSTSSVQSYANSCVLYHLCNLLLAVLCTQKLGQRTAKGILRLRMSADVSSVCFFNAL
jgi:hypothetical protein